MITAMKTNFFSNSLRVLCLFLTSAALIGSLSVPARAATFNTYAEAISGTYYFPRPMLRVGEEPPSESESELLWQILDGWRASGQQSGLPDLEMFLEAYTNSPWAPSLHANLGKYYLDSGYITLALEHWEQAWLSTQHYRSGNGKSVADYTLAHWTRLLASLGRFETLAALFQQNWDRVLDHGPLSQMWARTREAIVEMDKYPG